MMKVSELTGALLDYWVSQCNPEGRPPACDHKLAWHPKGKRCYYLGYDGGHRKVFSPSERWEYGGPIVDREITHLTRHGPTRWSALAPGSASGHGPTPLIAAMRAYVASKFGDEVPDEVA